eukprot:scaffold170376_cov15-Tisochrysis_lutea.AAC.1
MGGSRHGEQDPQHLNTCACAHALLGVFLLLIDLHEGPIICMRWHQVDTTNGQDIEQAVLIGLPSPPCEIASCIDQRCKPVHLHSCLSAKTSSNTTTAPA